MRTFAVTPTARAVSMAVVIDLMANVWLPFFTGSCSSQSDESIRGRVFGATMRSQAECNGTAGPRTGGTSHRVFVEYLV